MPSAAASRRGWSFYAPQDVELLRFIRRAKSPGLRLDEIKEIIDLERQGTQPCGKVLHLLGSHFREIDRTIADLRALKRALVQARDTAQASDQRGEAAVVCRIVESQEVAVDGQR